MAMEHDLMFLELLLGMIIKHRDEGEEECDKWISGILYNQNGPKYFIHSKAKMGARVGSHSFFFVVRV